jgi:predicted MFS family arabinose efflux permease
VPESRSPSAKRLDLAGALLATAGLGGVVFGLIEAPGRGWSHPAAWAPVAVGVAALAAFAFVEARSRHPMVPLELFRIRTFAAANLLTLLLYAALAALFFFLPFDLIQARGYSPAAAGAAILPMIALIAALSRPAGMLLDKAGARLPLIAGPSLAAAGFFLLAIPSRGAGYAASLLPALVVLGLGMAVTVAPLTATVLNSVDRADAGVASGINNAVARVAGLLAIALFGLLVTAAFNRSFDRRVAGVSVSAATRAALAAERSKLGGMRAPAGAPESEKRAVEDAVRGSLDASFRLVASICAGLALLSAGCAAVGVSKPSRRRGSRPAGD